MDKYKLRTELIEKAKKAKSALELIEMAKAEGIELSQAQAKRAYEQLTPMTGEIDDIELDNVSGGACDCTWIQPGPSRVS